MKQTRCLITPRAKKDLHEIRDYLQTESEDAWPRLSTRLRAAFQRAAEFPNSGHLRSDIDDPRYRVMVVGTYLVVYVHERRPVAIARVLDARRDVGRFFHRS